jgi:hypothetical protein
MQEVGRASLKARQPGPFFELVLRGRAVPDFRAVPSWWEFYKAPQLYWPTKPRGEISNGRKLKAKANDRNVASRTSCERSITKSICSYGRHTDSRKSLSQLSRHFIARTSALRV